MSHLEGQFWYVIFRRLSVLLAVQVALVTLLCYYAGYDLSDYYNFSSPQVAGLWCVISGIVVLQVLIRESFSAGWLRIFGSFIGALMSYIFAAILGYNVMALSLCVFFTVMLTSLLRIKKTFRLACLTAAIVIIIGMMQPGVLPIVNASSRFIESAIGACIAIMMTALFFPLRKKLHLLQH